MDYVGMAQRSSQEGHLRRFGSPLPRNWRTTFFFLFFLYHRLRSFGLFPSSFLYLKFPPSLASSTDIQPFLTFQPYLLLPVFQPPFFIFFLLCMSLSLSLPRFLHFFSLNFILNVVWQVYSISVAHY